MFFGYLDGMSLSFFFSSAAKNGCVSTWYAADVHFLLPQLASKTKPGELLEYAWINDREIIWNNHKQPIYFFGCCFEHGVSISMSQKEWRSQKVVIHCDQISCETPGRFRSKPLEMCLRLVKTNSQQKPGSKREKRNLCWRFLEKTLERGGWKICANSVWPCLLLFVSPRAFGFLPFRQGQIAFFLTPIRWRWQRTWNTCHPLLVSSQDDSRNLPA